MNQRKSEFLRFGRLALCSLLTLALYPVFGLLPAPLPCADKTAQTFALAICGGMGLYLLLGGRSHWLLVGTMTMALLALWLGSSYPMNQLKQPVFGGFNVTTQTRGTFRLAPGAVLTLAAGQPTALQPLTAVATVRCNWISAQGGAFDDPQSCTTVYSPPHSETDIIKVSIRPACGLPGVVEQIKISILPP